MGKVLKLKNIFPLNGDILFKYGDELNPMVEGVTPPLELPEPRASSAHAGLTMQSGVVWSFRVCVAHDMTPLKTNVYPLKIDDWEINCAF